MSRRNAPLHPLFLLALGVTPAQFEHDVLADPGNDKLWREVLISRNAILRNVSGSLCIATWCLLEMKPVSSMADWLQPVPYGAFLYSSTTAFFGFISASWFVLCILLIVTAASVQEQSHHPRKMLCFLLSIDYPMSVR
ncbi:uncharacterized protein EDB91DRAFT_1250438 [Suillus paluster]|uniref:uncharacterized protein n=1 Tax=Suillus paluster TaxID=48578 RepID=UPI001B875D4C|nr:uncharacterized protein EDB91DRAFT_1250438 [Suillus paluster]KAG1735602.1 hypothetical protein EDB91DRAFT_1250438 [Suillus paluster]